MSSEANNLCLSKDTDAEVELISLVYENLPRYRLKADSNVQFSGYQHSDFKRAENILEDITELSNSQIEKTLEYFLLCGLRVTKMTETYEDCAALRLLVEEQKAHMDEAANIGLNLLQRNIQLEQRLNVVEDQLGASKDTINQLRHQLHLKDDLLRLLHSEIEDAEDNSQVQNDLSTVDNNFSLDKVNLKNLESKLNKLEEENTKLRNQHNSLNSHTDFLENKEQQLIDDCVRQLLDSTKTVDRLTTDLNKKTNDYLNQHEEISRLLTTNIDLENKIHQLLTENDHIITQLRDHQTKQFTLTKELTDLRDRYDECLNLLNEKQDQIRQLKKKCKREMMKQIHGYRSGSPDINLGPSLAMEFEDSNRKDSIIAEQSRAIRVMEQARTINSSWLDTDETSSGFTEDMNSSIINTDMETSIQEHSGGNYLLRKSIQEDCEKRRIYRSNVGDLDSSLLDSQMEESMVNTVASVCTREAYRHLQSRCQTIRSLNTNILNSEPQSLHPQNIYKIPDKLQLVKPIEGSQTLRTWQNLATPSITKALFEEQSQSICFRGQQPLILSPSPSSPNSEHSHSGEVIQSLHSSIISSDCDDVDYDEPIPVVQSNSPSSSSTYTYTNAKADDTRNSNPACTNSITSSITTSQRKDAASGFSLNLDLVHGMNERGTIPIGKCSGDGSYQDDNTPVNEVDDLDDYVINEKLPNYCSRYVDNTMLRSTRTDSSSYPDDQRGAVPSWLDRLTVKSIMTSILGYPLPHLQKAVACSSYVTTTSNQYPITSPAPAPAAPAAPSLSSSSSSSSSSSIIGRLTNLPPLAQRRFPQSSGLNLLTSVANSISHNNTNNQLSSVLHRVSNFRDSRVDIDCDNISELEPSSPQSNTSQID